MTKIELIIAAKLCHCPYKQYNNHLHTQTADQILEGPLAKQLILKKTEAKRTLESLERLKASIYTLDNPDYPAALRAIPNPPYFLSFIGNANVFKTPGISIVGTRSPSFNSLRWIELELKKLRDKYPHLVIISGGARGIDQKAHDTSLVYNLPTLVVLPSGLATPYPLTWSKQRWLAIQEKGGFLSEFLPEEYVHKKNFHPRNRIIAALSRCCLVIQSHIKSGTMITARHALDLGREILTIPDFPTNYHSSGNLKLLREGATLTTDYLDLEVALHRNYPSLLQNGSDSH